MNSKKNIILGMIILGSACGLIEVVVKGLLSKYSLHFSGLIIGLDFIIIGIALAIFRKPSMVLGMGLIACLCKQLGVPLLCQSLMCKANSCLAVMLEFGAFAGLAALTLNQMKESKNARILTAGMGILAGSVLFYSIGMNVRPCPYLLSFNVAGGFSKFLLKEGLVWSVFAALFFPLGWAMGESLRERVVSFSLDKPRTFSAGITFASICCWLACAAAILSGI